MVVAVKRPVFLGGLVLLVAWVFGPALAGPPLYDGIGFPDEPYRYMDRPPKTVQMPPPTTATGTAKRLAGGDFDAIVAASAEQGPQVLVTIGGGTLTAPAGCAAVSLTAAPLAPPATVAGDPTWGNAYRLTLACDAGGTPTAARAGTNHVQLRAPDASQPGPDVYYAPSAAGPWQRLDTVRIGNDNYQAPLVGPGLYVLVKRPASGLPFGLDPIVAVLIGVVLALVAIIAAIRFRRSRAGATGENRENSSPPR
jgi:hypothetical protein